MSIRRCRNRCVEIKMNCNAVNKPDLISQSIYRHALKPISTLRRPKESRQDLNFEYCYLHCWLCEMQLKTTVHWTIFRMKITPLPKVFFRYTMYGIHSVFTTQIQFSNFFQVSTRSSNAICLNYLITSYPQVLDRNTKNVHQMSVRCWWVFFSSIKFFLAHILMFITRITNWFMQSFFVPMLFYLTIVYADDFIATVWLFLLNCCRPLSVNGLKFATVSRHS